LVSAARTAASCRDAAAASRAGAVKLGRPNSHQLPDDVGGHARQPITQAGGQFRLSCGGSAPAGTAAWSAATSRTRRTIAMRRSRWPSPATRFRRSTDSSPRAWRSPRRTEALLRISSGVSSLLAFRNGTEQTVRFHSLVWFAAPVAAGHTVPDRAGLRESHRHRRGELRSERTWRWLNSQCHCKLLCSRTPSCPSACFGGPPVRCYGLRTPSLGKRPEQPRRGAARTQTCSTGGWASPASGSRFVIAEDRLLPAADPQSR